MPAVCWLLKATRISAWAELQPGLADSCPAGVLGTDGAVGGWAVRSYWGAPRKNHDS